MLLGAGNIESRQLRTLNCYICIYIRILCEWNRERERKREGHSEHSETIIVHSNNGVMYILRSFAREREAPGREANSKLELSKLARSARYGYYKKNS